MGWIVILIFASLTVPTYDDALIERPVDNSDISSLPDSESNLAMCLTDSSRSKLTPSKTESDSGDLFSHSDRSIEMFCIFIRTRRLPVLNHQFQARMYLTEYQTAG